MQSVNKKVFQKKDFSKIYLINIFMTIFIKWFFHSEYPSLFYGKNNFIFPCVFSMLYLKYYSNLITILQ